MAYTSAGPSYVNSPFEQSHSSRAQSETTAGEFWTLKRDGEDWPVVICDDEIVQTFFKGRQRPFNARRPDGTWADGYKSGEDGIGQRCYPAILLGKLKLWVYSIAPLSFGLTLFQKRMGSMEDVRAD